MKKLIPTLLLLFITNTAYSQYFILEGKISWEPKNEKIYYAKEGEKFSEENFITTDENGKYIFKTNIKDLQEDGADIIIFTDHIDPPYFCIDEINIRNILDSKFFEGQESITLANDFGFSKNCSITSFSAKENGVGEPVGDYILTIDNSSYNLKLEDESCSLIAVIKPIDEDYMTRLDGNWEYSEKKNLLSLKINDKTNPEFGTALSLNKEYEFTVVKNEDGSMKFESDNENIKLEKQ